MKPQKIKTGFLNVLILRSNCAKHSDYRLACIMLHNIATIYRVLKHK